MEEEFTEAEEESLQDSKTKKVAKKVAPQNQDVVELTEEVTQTQPAFKLPNGEVVRLNDYLVWLGNEVYKIRRSIA